MSTCASCGAELEPDHRFCPSCGAAAGEAEREARKVVTALFCDVVGSTALGERLDPEDFTEVVGEAVARMARAVEEFGGTVVELAGDGLLALFGAPAAHEDDAERAVRAGLRIVAAIEGHSDAVARERGIEGFAVRVGVETGLAILGPLGAGRKVEYSAMGDALNTAARLQAAADAGTVLVGERTQRAAAGAFHWGPPCRLELKGKSEPVTAFPVEGVADAPEPRRAGEAPLVGRAAELAAGEVSVAAVAEGAGGALFVLGEGGIGKSRLIRELRERFAAQAGGRGRWLHARCASYGQDVPYHPLRALLGATPELIVAAGPEAEPFLLGLLEEPAAGAPRLAPEGVQERTQAAVAALLAALAERGPVVVSLDDLHWADPSTLDLLDTLLDLTDDVALLLVFAARPERDHGAWSLRERALRELPHRARELSLDELDADAGRALLEALVGGDRLPEELERRILERAEGNPFYLEEIVRSMREAGTGVEVPETVEKLVLSRIDRLDGETYAVLSAAAVLGRQFELPVLEHLVDDGDLRAALRELQRLELLRQGARWPVPEYRFRHSLIQEAAYGALLRRRRQELHRRAAEAIAAVHGERADDQAGVLARHRHEAGDLEEAYVLHCRAAEAAQRIFAQEEALEHLDGALAAAAALGRGPEDADVRRLFGVRGGIRYGALGDFEGSLADWETVVRAARDAGDRVTEVDALASSASALRVSDWPRALATMEEAVAVARASGDPSLIVGALARHSITHSNLLRLDAALALGDEALEVAAGTDDPWDRVVALDALKLAALMLGDLPRLRALCDELLELLATVSPEGGSTSQFGAESYRSWVLEEGAFALAGERRWDEAEAQVQEALGIARRQGHVTHTTVFLETLARIRRGRGDVSGALEAAEQAIDRAGRSANHEWQAWAEATAGWALVDAGRVDEALARLEAALARARRVAATMPQVRAAGLLARVHLERGAIEAGAASAAEAERLLGDASFPPGGAFLYGAHAIAGAARAFAAAGEPARGLALAEPALAAARAAGWGEAEDDLAAAVDAARSVA